jgi:hypothetical protein
MKYFFLLFCLLLVRCTKDSSILFFNVNSRPGLIGAEMSAIDWLTKEYQVSSMLDSDGMLKPGNNSYLIKKKVSENSTNSEEWYCIDGIIVGYGCFEIIPKGHMVTVDFGKDFIFKLNKYSNDSLCSEVINLGNNVYLQYYMKGYDDINDYVEVYVYYQSGYWPITAIPRCIMQDISL